MRPTDAGRGLAISAVLARMRTRRIYDGKALADQANLDADTVRDFLNGERWPRVGTLSKIEQTLGMEAGEISALGREDGPYIAAHAAAPSSAKTLDAANDVELLMELLSRATARLGDTRPEN